ncbi:hypothetical protein [Levilactobacillus spicheri]|uniref:Toxin n=1 Tax=Levilactobacillus spicheri TaxID=216463 RepID=A0A0F3RY57_9LACO|nr:hypothetical protein [Levilactobacillus spicheri]KJW13752.1 hypothetical protein VC81_00770 [Levilactobacillus spicheri]
MGWGREAEVKQVIALVKSNREKWRMSHRRKNMAAMVTLGIDRDEILNEIYAKITWLDYVSGPENDNHTPPIPGPIWVFGLNLEDVECYLKFQIKNENIIFWISVHPAEHALVYPYKR